LIKLDEARQEVQEACRSKQFQENKNGELKVVSFFMRITEERFLTSELCAVRENEKGQNSKPSRY